MTSYSVILRDINNKYIGEASAAGDWDNLTLVQHFCDAGTITVDINPGTLAYALLPIAYGIAISRNGVVLDSGPIEKITYTWDVDAGPSRIEASNYMRLLKDRVCYPSNVASGSAPGALTFSAVNDTITDNAENVIYHYVKNNLGPSADADRQNSNIIYGTSSNRGATLKGQERFTNLLGVLRKVVFFEPSLAFTIAEQTNGQLLFSVYAVADKTASVVFGKSSPGILTKAEYTIQRPIGNYIPALGSGAGTGRNVYAANDTGSITQWGRIEAPFNSGNMDTAGGLPYAAQAQVNQDAHIFDIKIETRDSDDPAGVVYGIAYQLGDMVTVLDPSTGTALTQVVREVHFTVDSANGELISIVVATPDKRHNVKRSKRNIVDMNQRVDGLETAA